MSLQKRLTLSSMAVLVVCASLIALGVERSLRRSLKQSQRDKMKGLVYALLGAIEVEASGKITLDFPERLDPRLAVQGSDLSIAIYAPDHSIVWSSPSQVTLREELPRENLPALGEWDFKTLRGSGRAPLFSMLFGAQWMLSTSEALPPWVIEVKEVGRSYQAQFDRFRTTLLAWVLGTTVLLLFVNYWVITWGFAPIRHFSRELQAIKKGESDEIAGEVPKEFVELKESLHSLIRHERGQQKRYRHALDDLAHSLKTPLAVLKNSGDETHKVQIDQMDHIIRYQLKRASTVGRQLFAEPVHIRKVVTQFVTAMGKIHFQKNLKFTIHIEDTLEINMEEGDLMEIFGNLIDNACKWAKSAVNISAQKAESVVTLTIDDDGPGFPEGAEKLLHRGVRADTKVEGQGIGLAVVHEMVSIYEGHLSLEKSSDLGGAKVVVRFPVS